MVKKLLVVLILTLSLILSGCTGSFEYNENSNEADNSLNLDKEENFYSITEEEITINEFDCRYNFRCGDSIELVEERENSDFLSFDFVYVGVQRINFEEASIRLSDGKNCNVTKIKNVDTQLELTDKLTFINGQTGRIEFLCENTKHSDVLEGITGEVEARTTNAKTGLASPHLWKFNFNKIVNKKTLKINEEVFPKIIGDYSAYEFEDMEEKELEVGIEATYKNINESNYNKIKIIFAKLNEEHKQEVEEDIFQEEYSKVENIYFMGGLRSIYFLNDKQFDIIIGDFETEKEVLEFDYWIKKNFQINLDIYENLSVTEYSSLEEYSGESRSERYQSGINVKVEQESQTGSSITIERLEASGTVYVKNIKNNQVEINVKIPNTSCNENSKGLIESQSVGNVKLEGCDMIKGKDYDVVAVTESGVYQATMIAR